MRSGWRFAFDAHWGADDFDLSELPEWNLRAGGGGDDDLLEGLEVFAEIAVVSQVNGITFESLDRGRERHASEGDFQHVLHVADAEAVAGNLIAVDQELDVVAAHDALGEDAAGIRHLADDSLDLCCDTFERGEVRAGDFDSNRRLDAGGKHVGARFDWHGPCVAKAGELDCGVHGLDEFLGRAPPLPGGFPMFVVDRNDRPVLLVLEHDRRFDHVEWSGVGSCLGPPDFSEDVVDLREALDDFVRLLDDFRALVAEMPGNIVGM